MTSPPRGRLAPRSGRLAARAGWLGALFVGASLYACGAAPARSTARAEPTAPMLGPYASLEAYCADEGLSADEEEGGLEWEDDAVVQTCAPLREGETASGTGSVVRAGLLRLTELGADRCVVFVDVVGGRTWLSGASFLCETRDLDPPRTLTAVTHVETTVEESSVILTVDLGGQTAGSRRATCRRDGPEWRCTDWLPAPAVEATVAETSP